MKKCLVRGNALFFLSAYLEYFSYNTHIRITEINVPYCQAYDYTFGLSWLGETIKNRAQKY